MSNHTQPHRWLAQTALSEESPLPESTHPAVPHARCVSAAEVRVAVALAEANKRDWDVSTSSPVPNVICILYDLYNGNTQSPSETREQGYGDDPHSCCRAGALAENWQASGSFSHSPGRVGKQQVCILRGTGEGAAGPGALPVWLLLHPAMSWALKALRRLWNAPLAVDIKQKGACSEAGWAGCCQEPQIKAVLF